MKKIIMLLTAMMLISACASQTPTNTPTASPQEKPTLTPVPTDTEMPFPPTATTVALPELETNCISVLPAPPADFEIKGTALFLDGPMIVSMGEKALRIPIGAGEPSVSPHNKFLAYYGGDLLVTTSNGTVIRRVESNIVYALVGDNWISDEYIRHLKLISWEPLQYQLLVINMQTGESLDLRMDFPDMEEGGWRIENIALYRNVTDAIYDPFLSRAAYPKKGSFISLYNVQEDREQAAIQIEGGAPSWSPDGRYFTFKGWEQRAPREIYIISRDGDQFMPLTYLATRYPEIIIGSYNWSPDSHKIAVWVNKEYKDKYESLFLFDFTTMKMRDVCIQGIGSWGSIIEAGLTSVSALPSSSGKYFDLGGRLVWSPDSTKIIIAQFDEENQQVIDLLVDLERNLAYPIATGLEPMGWMSGEP